MPYRSGRGTDEGGFGLLDLETLIERRVSRVGVVGLGYVGLPLAVEFAKAAFGVVGIDVDRRKVERVLRVPHS